MWPDRRREEGARFLGTLALERADAERLWECVRELMKVVGGSSLASVLRWPVQGDPVWWRVFTGLYALAVTEFSYWDPDVHASGDEADSPPAEGFWLRWHTFIGDPHPSIQTRHDASRELVDKGLAGWGVRRAPRQAHKFVDSVWMQNGLPRRLHHDLIEFVHQLGDLIGWAHLANEVPARILPSAQQLGAQSWAHRSLRHAFGANADWTDVDPDLGVLLRDLARVELLRQAKPPGLERITTAILADRGIDLTGDAWRRFRGREDLVTAMYRGLIQQPGHEPDGAATSITLRAGLGWSDQTGIAVWLEQQQLPFIGLGDQPPLDLEVALRTRASRSVIGDAARYDGDQIKVEYSECALDASFLGQSVWWEVRDRSSVLARSGNLLTSQDLVLKVIPLSRVDSPAPGESIEAERVVALSRGGMETSAHLVLAGKRHATAPIWPPGVRAAECRVPFLQPDWVAWHLERIVAEVVLRIGGRDVRWCDPGERARLCGLVASPTPTQAGDRVRYLARPTLWVPEWLTEAMIEWNPIGVDEASLPAVPAGPPELVTTEKSGLPLERPVPWDAGEVAVRMGEYQQTMAWVVARQLHTNGPRREPARPSVSLVDHEGTRVPGVPSDGEVDERSVAFVTHDCAPLLRVHMLGLWPGERVAVFVCVHREGAWRPLRDQTKPQATLVADESGSIGESGPRGESLLALTDDIDTNRGLDLAIVIRGGVWPRGACLAVVRAPIAPRVSLDPWEKRVDDQAFGRIARAIANVLRRNGQSIRRSLYEIHLNATRVHREKDFEREVARALHGRVTGTAPWSPDAQAGVDAYRARVEVSWWYDLFSGTRTRFVRTQLWGGLKEWLRELHFESVPPEPLAFSTRIDVGSASPFARENPAGFWHRMRAGDAQETQAYARTIVRLTHAWRDPANPWRPQTVSHQTVQAMVRETVPPPACPTDTMIDQALDVTVARGDLVVLDGARYAPARPIIVTSSPSASSDRITGVLFGDRRANWRRDESGSGWPDGRRPTRNGTFTPSEVAGPGRTTVPTVTMRAWLDSVPALRLPLEPAHLAEIEAPPEDFFAEVRQEWPQCLSRTTGQWEPSTDVNLRSATVVRRHLLGISTYGWWNAVRCPIEEISAATASAYRWVFDLRAKRITPPNRRPGTDGMTEFRWNPSEQSSWWNVPNPHRVALAAFVLAVTEHAFVCWTDEAILVEEILHHLLLAPPALTR